MPRTGSSIAAISSSVAAGSRRGTSFLSTTWRARSLIAAALAPDSPTPRSAVSSVARIAAGLGNFDRGYSARNRPQIVSAALPESCCETIARASECTALVVGVSVGLPWRSITGTSFLSTLCR